MFHSKTYELVFKCLSELPQSYPRKPVPDVTHTNKLAYVTCFCHVRK